MSEKLTPEEVASLDPFGVRRIPASEELTRLLKEEGKETLVSLDWTRDLISKEREALEQFFGKEIRVPSLPPEITQEKLRNWQQLRMKLHFLPAENMTRDKNFPGWNIRPHEWFYEKIRTSSIPKEALRLPGKWILVDTRDKPHLQDGNQVYPEDFLGQLVENLRYSGKLKECQVPQSRAFISPEDYFGVLRPRIAKILGVKTAQVRLPRAVEFNFLTNAYPQWVQKTNTGEWVIRDGGFDGGFELWGGGSFKVLASRGQAWTLGGHRLNVSGFRPLVEF